MQRVMPWKWGLCARGINSNNDNQSKSRCNDVKPIDGNRARVNEWEGEREKARKYDCICIEVNRNWKWTNFGTYNFKLRSIRIFVFCCCFCVIQRIQYRFTRIYWCLKKNEDTLQKEKVKSKLRIPKQRHVCALNGKNVITYSTHTHARTLVHTKYTCIVCHFDLRNENTNRIRVRVNCLINFVKMFVDCWCACVYINLTYSHSFKLSLSLSRSFHFYPLCLVISLVLYLLIDISFRKWCSSGMLDFNSFQWSERTVICDADACNPFSMLRSVPNSFFLLFSSFFFWMYEWWRELHAFVWYVCVCV